MRLWLLGHLPSWSVSALWWFGMAFGAVLVLALVSWTYVAFAAGWHDESAMAVFLGLVAAGVAVLTARSWWSELRRHQAELSADRS